MATQNISKPVSAVFITFAGNCKMALTFYQSCFGGVLNCDTFDKSLPGFGELPVVTGSLVSDRISIYGSDLVHEEGRKLGNHMAVYLRCESANERKAFVEKLTMNATIVDLDAVLIEITDAFDVRWVLG